MSSSNLRPKWWQLYLSFPLLIALFVLDTRLRISVRGHQVVQIGILLLVYGLVHLWLKANASALSNLDQRQYYRTVNVVRVPGPQMSDLEAEELPMIELPASEIRGVLSDTFEMDYIDMDAAPEGDVSEVLKSEHLWESYLDYVPLVEQEEHSSKPSRNQLGTGKQETKRMP